MDGTDPNDGTSFLDTDGDGHPDYVEDHGGGDKNDANTGPTDSDGDGVPDLIEDQQGTNKNDNTSFLDTDGDGYPDYVENVGGGNANDANTGPTDSDGDGVPDIVENAQGTDPSNPDDGLDTDGDGVPDFVEIQDGTDPNDPNSVDSDHDGTPNASDTDDDGDGVPDSVEAAGPNGGDANGDGIQDSTQTDVSTIINPVTGAAVTLDTTDSPTKCIVISYSVVGEASLAVEDTTSDYPVGLNQFTLSCANPGDSAEVVVIYDKLYDTTDWSYKKYDDAGNTYSDITSLVTYDSTTIGGNLVTRATYTVTDGGPTDTDGLVNGTIVDPAGPAVLVDSSLSSTGQAVGLTVAVGVAVAVVAATTTKTRQRSSRKRS